jgi:hypothetical protein
MAVLDPVLLVISGLAEATGKAVSADGSIVWEVPDFPFDPARGSHTLPMTDRIFIDRSDVRIVDSEVSPAPSLALTLSSGFLRLRSKQSRGSQVRLQGPSDLHRSR